ncbi:MAG: glutaredoxin domain-containing protein [Synechococcaceae cyanobacterium]|nr:glutaredoxin domain-containing protein [Synechococcaceae cyanobacterium]
MDAYLSDSSAQQPRKTELSRSLAHPGVDRLSGGARSESDTPAPWVAKVEIYTRRFCADSMRTKGIFDRKNVQYNEYLIDNDIVNNSAMIQRTAGLDTTPQVFIDGNLIGGLRQVMELEQSGDLDFILGTGAS